MTLWPSPTPRSLPSLSIRRLHMRQVEQISCSRIYFTTSYSGPKMIDVTSELLEYCVGLTCIDMRKSFGVYVLNKVEGC